MMPKKVIKIICLVMAALMLLSVFAVVLQVFAVDGDVMLLSTPATGDNDGDYLIPAGIGIVALLAVGICLVLPKLKNKK